jgi:large subunit ribosomal protein L4
MEIPVYSIAGQVIDHVAVDEVALGGVPNLDLIRQAVIMYEANRRVGTVKVKTRGDLQGSDRKPWRQKHTGRARQGTRNSPVWVGGGVAHGPRPRSYRQKMNRAARRRALYSAFLAKAQDGEVIAVDDLQLPEMKTREMAVILENLGADRTFLIVLADHDPELWRCTRNIQGSSMAAVRELNAYEMIRPRRVIFVLDALRNFLEEAAREIGAREEAGVSEDG